MDGEYFLTEVSFEAGNKVGGIWTVVTSKSTYIKEKFGDNYLAIGFYNPAQAAVEFIETAPPQFVKDAVSEFRLEGVKIYFGKWVSANDANIILIDSREFETKHGDAIKKEFWDKFRIDSLNSPQDYTEPLVWSYAAGAFVEALNKNLKMKMVVQVHEWLSAGVILYLKSKGVRVPTVFTVHATVLGRAYAYSGNDTFEFVNNNKSISPDMPYKYGVAAKHFIEVAGAMNATIFTAVSRIVQKEAEVILGKKADFVTFNGIDTQNLPSEDELESMRTTAKNKFANFINSYFLPYYDISFKNAPVFLTSGRYEFLDKGFDIFIDALGKLDKILPEDNYVIALITVPSGTIGVKDEVVANYLTYIAIKSALDADLKNFDQLVSNNLAMITDNMSIDKAYSKIQNDIRRMVSQLRRLKLTNPPTCPFKLSYPEDSDAILNRLRYNGLENRVTNHVKVIFYPKYLTVGDELLNITYNEALSLSTAGFFPSKYEPFGYTPLEDAAHMSIAFTTDHSGFADYAQYLFKNSLTGIIIEPMLDQTRDEIVSKLTSDMLKIVMMSEDDRFSLRLSARRTAENFGWDKFISNYLEAYEAALERIP